MKLVTKRNVEVTTGFKRLDLGGACRSIIYRRGTGMITFQSNTDPFDIDVDLFPGESFPLPIPIEEIRIKSTVGELIDLAVGDDAGAEIKQGGRVIVGGELAPNSSVVTVDELGFPVVMGMAYQDGFGVWHNPPLKSLDGQALLVDTPRELINGFLADLWPDPYYINMEGFACLRVQFSSDNSGDNDVYVVDQWGQPLTCYSTEGAIQAGGLITIANINACKTYYVPCAGVSMVGLKAAVTLNVWSIRWGYSKRLFVPMKA